MSNEKSFSTEELSLPGVIKITPRVFSDDRGLSTVTYGHKLFEAIGITTSFQFEYFSYSKKGTIRGMHFQRSPHAQDKLVRCAYGEILDVIFDFDRSSPTFGQHIEVMLNMQEQTMLYIPGQYAHGFCVCSESAVVEYKLSEGYEPEMAGGIRYDDTVLNMQWPVTEPIISKRDGEWPDLVS